MGYLQPPPRHLETPCSGVTKPPAKPREIQSTSSVRVVDAEVV